jgi:hypothetical protein
MYEWRDIAVAGGLASCGSSSLADGLRQAGVYTGKNVAGAKVTDLPVVQTTKFEFVINLRTAKALGIEVPPIVSARADDVIESRWPLPVMAHLGLADGRAEWPLTASTRTPASQSGACVLVQALIKARRAKLNNIPAAGRDSVIR